jgi:hypothetical protein
MAKDGRPHWTAFAATEHWAALVDDDEWGLGVIHPDVVRFLGGFSGKPNTGGPDDNPTGYIAPVRQEILDHNIVYEFRYTLVLDNLANIRKEAYKQRPKSAVPVYHFASDRQHWWFLNAEDTGYPIKGHLRLKVEKNDPQMYGPSEDKIPYRARRHVPHLRSELISITILSGQDSAAPVRSCGIWWSW